MNDISAAPNRTAEGWSVSNHQQGTPSPHPLPAMPGAQSSEGEAVKAETAALVEAPLGDLQALSRLVAGILILGGEELMNRLRMLHETIEADPAWLEPNRGLENETTAALVWYLTMGLLARGQREVVRGIQSGLTLSVGTTGWVLGKLNRFSDNRLMRRIRRPIESRLRRLGQATGVVIREGQREEEKSRLLAAEVLGGIFDDVLDFVGRNPEMQHAIRGMIGQQSIGFATVVRDSARQLTATSDDVTEGVVRRLLGRRPRRSLPASPLQGLPQTMYAPERRQDLADKHDA